MYVNGKYSGQSKRIPASVGESIVTFQLNGDEADFYWIEVTYIPKGWGHSLYRAFFRSHYLIARVRGTSTKHGAASGRLIDLI
jgi:hypothetical protein